MAERRSTAVIGAGWAGLAAAVEATSSGDIVTVFEMAPTLGGRARSVDSPLGTVDNGQHIAIGAYRETLNLMAQVGLDESQAFVRMPLALFDAQGHGLQLRGGRPALAFALAVRRHRRWPWAARLALLRASIGWLVAGFKCAPSTTVARLTQALPLIVRDELIEPLCVAALNTPAATASGQVFLRVMHAALFDGAGTSDLLLPRRPLGDILPEPAARWLRAGGTTLNVSTRVESLTPMWSAADNDDGWLVDGVRFDRVILAASSQEAARLVAPIAPAWSATAAALGHEAIVTVYARSEGSALPHPMLMLQASPAEPAQFVFDRGQLDGPAGLFAFVVSGANDWVGRNDAVERAVLSQATRQLGAYWQSPLHSARVINEKRATFACTPGIVRPPGAIAPGLSAAGDYVDGPYPATLEGAVRSGRAAARASADRAGSG